MIEHRSLLLRRALLLALVASGVFSLAAGPPAGAQEKILLRIQDYGAIDATTPDAKARLALRTEFRRANPNIELKGTNQLNVPGVGAMDAGPLMAIAGGTAPDVMYVNFRQSETYISQGFLYPLDEFINDPKKMGSLKLNVPAQVWPVIKRRGPDGKVHVWCLPSNPVVNAMNYRKDLLRAGGWDPEHPPKTWDEFVLCCLKVTRPEKNIYAMNLAVGGHASWYMYPFLGSAGCDPVKEVSENDWRANFDTEEAVTAYLFWHQLFKIRWTRCPRCDEPIVFKAGVDDVRCEHDATPVNRKEVDKKQKLYKGICTLNDPQAWGQGRIAFMGAYMSDETLSQQDPGIVGITRWPVGPSGKSRAEVNSLMWGINSQVKDPRVRDAAWKWVSFLCSQDARRITTKVFVDNGYAKFVNPKWLRQFGYHQYLRDIPRGWEEVHAGALRDGVPEPYGKNCQLIYLAMTKPIDQSLQYETISRDQMRGFLKEAVKDTNDKIIGYIPAAVQRMRSRVTIFLVLIIAAMFALGVYKSLKHYAKNTSVPESRPAGINKRLTFLGFLFLAPAVISIAVWAYYPLARGSLMAFQDYQIVGKSTWVGLANFNKAVFNPDFWMTLLRSAQYAGLVLGLGFLTPIFLALLLHEVPRGTMVYRVIYYLPAVTTGVVIALLWKLMYTPGPNGFLNQALGLAHIPPQDWIASARWAMICCIFPVIWAGMGPGCIIYLAAMRAIPAELYEAAEIDGSGFWGKFFNVTVPFLKFLIVINFTGAFIGAFKAFDTIFLLTGGGPADATKVLGLEVWYNAYMFLRYGYATAMAWILGSLLIGFTLYQLRILSRVQFKTASSGDN